MHPYHQFLLQNRRNFLTSTASGVGLLALASMLRDEGLLAASQESDKEKVKESVNPLAPKEPHFKAKAKSCICIYLEGAPSQMDLYDPKPKLSELDGQKLPDDMLKQFREKGKRFAFLQMDTARIMGSPRKFKKHGQCGMDFSDLLPNLATCADDICMVRSMVTDQFNHHPGQLAMNTGVPMFGRPSMGSWINYGLGSESKNLPGYVVLTAGVGTSGGTSNWSSGFLPSTYQGVLFRNQGEPILNLNNPPGLSKDMQQKTIQAVSDLNSLRQQNTRDPEINSRIAAYELAFRMQEHAPELIDLKHQLSGETKQTLDDYGVHRKDQGKANRGGRDVYHTFALNCLLARRMVERGVRFVNLYHASWDHHSDLDKELVFNAGMADRPLAALLKDLKQRKLLDSTLVMCISEFGRTPLGENRRGSANVSGRDHHPDAFTIWLAGGGVKGGQIVGKTDELGWDVVEDKIVINDFHATMLKLFGLDHLKLTYPFQGRDFRLTDVAGKVVDKLLA